MFTILGGSGFVGRRVCQRLSASGVEYVAPARDELLTGRELGDVIYCIGLTADFRTKTFETVEAHVGKLLGILRDCDFDSLLYLSSTRLYGFGPGIGDESVAVSVEPLRPDDLYNISKAMGESLSLHSQRNTRVARLSNVYGDDFSSENFLASIIMQAVSVGKVVLETSAGTAKDYVNIEDVVGGLIDIAARGTERIYNIASGINVSNGELVDRLRSLTDCEVEYTPGARTLDYPKISTVLMRREFDFRPSSVVDDMAELVDRYKSHVESRA
jgi:nucleoside-diphosphate-sugar epimerase